MADLETLKEAISDLAESPEMTASLGKRAAAMTEEFMAGASPDQLEALKEWLNARLGLSSIKPKARAKFSYQNRRAHILQCALDRAEGRPATPDDDWD
jgi:hypothetical protein